MCRLLSIKYLQMPYKAMSHEVARGKVCAICTGEYGLRACRSVSEKEVQVIKKLVPDYKLEDMRFPSGICMRCVYDLKKKSNGEEVVMQLPEDYMCAELKRDTRAQEGVLCVCCWCKQARLSGLDFRCWQAEKKSVKKRLKVDRLCQYCYRGLAQGQQSHVCNVSKEEAVNNLALNLPAEITAKLSHTYISSQVTVGGDC